MKVPQQIKKAIMDLAKYNVMANEKDEIVRKWMHHNNLLNDGNIDMLIDSTTVGYNYNPEACIKHFENDSFNGNADCYIGEYED